jgi:hypothetical protein
MPQHRRHSCDEALLPAESIDMTNRLLTTLAFVALVASNLTACGDGSSDETVASIAGVDSISKATLDHWIPVEAVVIYEEDPKTPVPRGVIPDPPRYSACIAYLRSTRQKLIESGPRPTTAQLKRRCVQRQNELRVLTLNTLIGWDWTIGTGIALGMKVSDAQARQRLADVNGRSFPRPGEFAKYLRLTRQTAADMLFRSRVQEFEAKLTQAQRAMEAQLPRSLSVKQRQDAVVGLLAMRNRWVAKTTCSRGYVVSACKEYRGRLAPGIPN